MLGIGSSVHLVIGSFAPTRGCSAEIIRCSDEPMDRSAMRSMAPGVLNPKEQQLDGPCHAGSMEQQGRREADEQNGRKERLKETERGQHDRDDILREGQE